MKKLLIPLSLLISVLLFALFLRGEIVHEKFNSNIWKTANLNTEQNMSLRWDMMNDLRRKYKLVGMTKNEILTLLGKPETEAKSDFIYYLGYSKHGINTGNLEITFDDKNIVIAMSVWQG